MVNSYLPALLPKNLHAYNNSQLTQYEIVLVLKIA